MAATNTFAALVLVTLAAGASAQQAVPQANSGPVTPVPIIGKPLLQSPLLGSPVIRTDVYITSPVVTSPVIVSPIFAPGYAFPTGATGFQASSGNLYVPIPTIYPRVQAAPIFEFEDRTALPDYPGLPIPVFAWLGAPQIHTSSIWPAPLSMASLQHAHLGLPVLSRQANLGGSGRYGLAGLSLRRFAPPMLAPLHLQPVHGVVGPASRSTVAQQPARGSASGASGPAATYPAGGPMAGPLTAANQGR